MKKLKITGTAAYQNLGTGFWGIIGDDGNEYLPINMPQQLKMEKAKITVTAHEVEVMTLFMWGTPIKITSFTTV